MRDLPAAAAAAFVCFAASPASLTAQAGNWTRQSPQAIDAGSNLFSVAMRSPFDVWCTVRPTLGNRGQIAHTEDGGAHWHVAPTPGGTLQAIFFVDAQHGWAAGNSFHRTVDGGRTWIHVNDYGTIRDLHFVSPQLGWAAGNGSYVYRTVDGGRTWLPVIAGFDNVQSVWFEDAARGWAVDLSGNIVQSTDGGRTWHLNHASGARLNTVQFVGPLEGWAIGGDTFLKTVDGGRSWSRKPVPSGTWAMAARFHGTTHGIAVGEAGNIVRTEDGGDTWSTVRGMGSGPTLWDVESCSPQIAACVGEGGAILRTVDGGKTWTQILNGATGQTRGLAALDSRTAWAANDGGEVQLTTDGGVHWHRVSVQGFDAYGKIQDVDFADAQHGWAVGVQTFVGAPSEARIARSTDGGRTWAFQHGIPLAELHGVVALDSQHAIAFGRGNFAASAYVATSDGGAHWAPDGPAAPGGWSGAHFLADRMTGWLVGNGIYHTTNGGRTWTLQYRHPSDVQFLSVSFADAQNGWAGAAAGIVAHTTDGGRTWSLQDPGAPKPPGAHVPAAITGVAALGATRVRIVGWHGFVAESSDAGQHWQAVALPDAGSGSTGAVFQSLQFVDADNGWVAGDRGIWRHRASADAAAFTPFGTACAGVRSDGPPVLDRDPLTGGLPWPGSTLTVQLRNLPAGAPVLAFVGASATSWNGLSLPFSLDPIGIETCSLQCAVDVAVPLGAAAPDGSAFWPLPIPVGPHLHGLELFVQACVAAPGANRLGLLFTNAAKVRIGPA